MTGAVWEEKATCRTAVNKNVSRNTPLSQAFFSPQAFANNDMTDDNDLSLLIRSFKEMRNCMCNDWSSG